MSSIAELQAELAALDAELVTVEADAAKIAECDTKIATLTKETETLEAQNAESRKYLAEFEEAKRTMPDNNTINKMEAHLDNLKISLSAARARVQDAQSGIAVYEQKRRENVEFMLKLTQKLMAAADEMDTDVLASVETEKPLKKTPEIIATCDEMLAIDTEQEDDLQRIYKQTQEAHEKLIQQTAEIRELEQEAAESLPATEAERMETLAEITGLWSEEKAILTSIYQRLLMINREQHHHLTRGTHIKTAPTKYTQVQLDTLSSTNARASAEANEHNARLREMNEEIAILNRRVSAARDKARKQQKEFEELKKEKETSLLEAQQELDAMQTEGNDLREVKADLTAALNGMGTKAVMMAQATPRTGRWVN